jgi:uncharacterized membrane protein YhaH (DUF805 family)
MDNPYQTPSADPKQLGGQQPYSKPSLKELLFSFSGRIPRRTYWGLSIAITVILYVVMFALFGIDEEKEPPTLGLVLFFFLFIPFVWMSLAIGVKRWHDRGKSGWMILVSMIPLVGPIWTFVECGCLRGTMGPNEYGQDPT